MKTRAYKNLTRNLWSLRQQRVVNGKKVWRVVGHCRSLSLYGVKAKVSAARHEAVRSTGNREVFAWLEGDLCMVDGFVSYEGREAVVDGGHMDHWACDRRVSFRPYEAAKRGFFWCDTGVEMTSCEAAHFTACDGVYCS